MYFTEQGKSYTALGAYLKGHSPFSIESFSSPTIRSYLRCISSNALFTGCCFGPRGEAPAEGCPQRGAVTPPPTLYTSLGVYGGNGKVKDMHLALGTEGANSCCDAKD